MLTPEEKKWLIHTVLNHMNKPKPHHYNKWTPYATNELFVCILQKLYIENPKWSQEESYHICWLLDDLFHHIQIPQVKPHFIKILHDKFLHTLDYWPRTILSYPEELAATQLLQQLNS
ncbi:hypothetical protein IC619_010885 [Hazenella sp. IB182353]|uniref:hypothetical protein n=1 Tax=Polycladospora coralii TaxID=2771432 RepID=UPI001745FF84|nr:hypothetical protein [Polycladospora coralii]MBS7530997.1 hypothetical protein [Polycladospora coralii]